MVELTEYRIFKARSGFVAELFQFWSRISKLRRSLYSDQRDRDHRDREVLDVDKLKRFERGFFFFLTDRRISLGVPNRTAGNGNDEYRDGHNDDPVHLFPIHLLSNTPVTGRKVEGRAECVGHTA